MLRGPCAECINLIHLSRFTIANTRRVRSRITRNWRILTTEQSRRTTPRVLQSKRTTFILRVPERANRSDKTSMRKHVCGDVLNLQNTRANLSLMKTRAGSACAVIRVDLNRRVRAKRESNLHLGTETLINSSPSMRYGSQTLINIRCFD